MGVRVCRVLGYQTLGYYGIMVLGVRDLGY